MARMAGQLCTRIICLSSAPGSERSVMGTPIPTFDWHAKAVRIGEVSFVTNGSILDSALRKVLATGCARPLFALPAKPANAC